MANHIHIPAEDGTVIQINAKELETPEGVKWLAEELEIRKNIHKKINQINQKSE